LNHPPLCTKARRHHKCTLCGKKIHEGETYFKEVITPWIGGNESDVFFTFKAHLECNAFWGAGFGRNCDYQFPDFNEFYQALREAKRSGQFSFTGVKCEKVTN
jgi:hypothetical protein